MKQNRKKRKLTAEQKLFRKIYGDYRSEALLLLPGLILSIGFIVFLAVLFWEKLLQGGADAIIVFAGLFLYCLFLYYFGWKKSIRFLIWSFVEPKYTITTCQKLLIVSVKIDYSSTKNRTDSAVMDFHDKKMQVNRYKILCRDENGKKVVLHCVASLKRIRFITMTRLARETLPCSVTYGKYSHVIWFFNNKEDDWADQFNHSF